MNTANVPQSKEAEMMVLGCMLTSVNSLNIAAGRLYEADFYFPEHQKIFHALQVAYKGDRPADVHLVCEELKRQNILETVGGPAYIATLAQYAGTSAFIDEYCDVVQAKSLLRSIIASSQKIEKAAFENPRDVFSLLDQAQQAFFRIGQQSNLRTGTLLSDVLGGVSSKSGLTLLKEIEQRQELFLQNGGKELQVPGLATGLLDLDKIINGLGASNLIILAARPAMGKTALALNVSEHICFKLNVPIGIFSLEMSADQLVHRMVCSQAEVESDKIRMGSLGGVDYQRIVTAVSRMQNHTMIIDDQPGLSITDLRARARRMKESWNIGAVVIDYLQLISGSGSVRSAENRQNEISEISRMLKTLARELDVPVLCCAQLSRRVEERQGHRPIMSDLRESGSIEQDADVVMFLMRRDYYDPLDKPGQADLIVAKNRHGATGDVRLTFRKELGQFANFSPIESGFRARAEELV